MKQFEIGECVQNVKLVKVEFKEGVKNKGVNKGNKYQLLDFVFAKEGAYLSKTVWAINKNDKRYREDESLVIRDKEASVSNIEQIGAVYLKKSGKMVEIKNWVEEQPRKNFKIFAKKFAEYLNNTDIRSTFVDIKVLPNRDGEPFIPKFGSFIRKHGDTSVVLSYTTEEVEWYKEYINN